MERCVAPSTVEPQASVQSGCSFQTVEFTSSPKKKTRRIIELPKLFHKKHHPQVDLRKYHPSPQDSSWQMKSRHFWGGIPPGKKCQLPTFPKCGFRKNPWKKDAPQTPWISPLVVKTSRNCSHNDNIDNSASGAAWEFFFLRFWSQGVSNKNGGEKNERTKYG